VSKPSLVDIEFDMKPFALGRSGQRSEARRFSVNTFRRFLDDETAASAIEYGLLAAGISLAIISSVSGVGTKLSTKFGSISTSLR
jgi:pilus assembly protein Flp/PilA